MGAPKGVYQIKSLINGKSYIGSSINIHKRWRLHKSELTNNKHHSIVLQRHVNKYGIKDLQFIILEETDESLIIEREQYYIDTLKPYFNIRKIADSNKGIKRSDETKERIRLANLGKKLSDSTKQKMANRMMGNAYTKNKVPVNARKVIDTTTCVIYDSITLAAKYINCKPRTLKAWLDGQNKNKSTLKLL